MARPLLPPKFVAIPSDVVYDDSVPAGVFRTYIRLRGLLWGKEDELQEFTINELMEVTGLSRSGLYGHLGILRDCGWLLSNSTHYSRITIYLHGGAQDQETAVKKESETQDEDPICHLSKNLGKVSRNLDRSIKEEVKGLKDPVLNAGIKPPPPDDHQVNPARAVQKTGQGVQKSGQAGGKTQKITSPNGWHDVIDAPLEGKLERLGVYPQVYGQIAEAVKSGAWTLEQVKDLADDILDLGDAAGPGVFIFRLKNRIRKESRAEKDEKSRNGFRKLFLAQREASNGA